MLVSTNKFIMLTLSRKLGLYCLFSLIIFLPDDSFGILEFEKYLVRNKYFVIGTVQMPPYILIRRHTDGSLSEVDGFVHQIVTFLANKFSFAYEYVEPSDKTTGTCLNGTCNGLVGMLVQGEIDIAATGLAISHSRSKVIDFTFEFHSDPISLLIPYPRKKNTIDGITDPFSYQIWMLILGSLFICSYFLLWISRAEAPLFSSKINSIDDEVKYLSLRRGVGFYAMFLLSVLVNPGYRLPPGFGEAFRFLVAVWCLCAVVICNSYTTSLKSFLTTPRYLPVINTLDELVANKDYYFVVQKYNSIWSNMMSATNGVYLKIGDSLRKHPENSFESLDEIDEVIVNQKRVLGQLKSLNLMLIANDYKTRGECRLHLGEDFDESRICFGLPKNSHFLNHFLSHELMWLRQSGLLTYWANSFWPRMNRCSAPITQAPNRQNEKLTINYLSGAFLLLVSGIGISIFSFICELLIGSRRKRRFSMIQSHVDLLSTSNSMNGDINVNLITPCELALEAQTL